MKEDTSIKIFILVSTSILLFVGFLIGRYTFPKNNNQISWNGEVCTFFDGFNEGHNCDKVRDLKNDSEELKDKKQELEALKKKIENEYRQIACEKRGGILQVFWDRHTCHFKDRVYEWVDGQFKFVEVL